MIPKNVLITLRSGLYAYEELFGQDAYSPMWDAVAEARKCLDAQPAAPEPDWTRAPEWAQWWTVNNNGFAIWWQEKPRMLHTVWHAESSWILIDRVMQLPLGIDWRTTLRKRPEATE